MELSKECPRCKGRLLVEEDPGKGDHWIFCYTCGQKGPNAFAPWNAWNEEEWRKRIDHVRYKVQNKAW